MHYLERIRNLREDADYSQAAIADMLNVAQTTYSDYEKGKVRIPVDLLIRLAQIYDVDMNYITGLSDKRAGYPHK